MGTVLIKIPEETEFELFLDQWLLAVNYVQRPLEHAVPALRTDTLATVPCELTDEQAQTVRNNTVPAAIDQSVALAKYPNVSVKVSAAPLLSSEPYPFHDLTPHICRLFDAYGPRRCYWGTDLTNSFAKATYRQRIAHFTEELDFLSEHDKDWIMGRAIVTRLGWA